MEPEKERRQAMTAPVQMGMRLLFGPLPDKPLAIPHDCIQWRIRVRPDFSVIFLRRKGGLLQKYALAETPEWIVPAALMSENRKGIKK